MKRVVLILLMIGLMALLTACGGGSASTSHISYTQTVPTKEPEMMEEISTTEAVRFADGGMYTFYNEEAGKYLSCAERTLVFGDTEYGWTLKQTSENCFNICAPETMLVMDIDNAYVAEGTAVKVWENTGYDVQIWNIEQNANGTYSILYSGNNDYCLGFENGIALLQKRDEANSMQEWCVTDIGAQLPKNYISYQSANAVVEVQLPLDALSVIEESRAQQWADDLETAYMTYYEMTGSKPFENIIVETYKPVEYEGVFGWVTNGSNIIHIGNQYIYDELAKMSARDDDWNFAVLHEMGHMFDFDKAWCFEAELMTDLKLAYVLEINNAAAAPAYFDASTVFYGAEIKDAYKTLSADFSQQYDVFGCTERFLVIKDEIGWEPFKQVFSYLLEHEAEYADSSAQEKFTNFVGLLSHYSVREIKSYFSDQEWNAVLNSCG